MNFFIQRPIFAMSIALVMILAGAICMLVLPIAQYPPLVPPQVQVSTQYIGAGSEVVDKTVTTPLEEQINEAAGMIYFNSPAGVGGIPDRKSGLCRRWGQQGRIPQRGSRSRLPGPMGHQEGAEKRRKGNC